MIVSKDPSLEITVSERYSAASGLVLCVVKVLPSVGKLSSVVISLSGEHVVSGLISCVVEVSPCVGKLG